jgi:hypothetical protein
MRRLVAVAVGTEQGRVVGRAAQIGGGGGGIGAGGGIGGSIGGGGGGGGIHEASIDVYGRDKREVAGWILNTTGAFVLNKPLPVRPAIVGAPRGGGGGEVLINRSTYEVKPFYLSMKPFYLSSEIVLPIKPLYLSNSTCTAT